jgi:hypothetical protein
MIKAPQSRSAMLQNVCDMILPLLPSLLILIVCAGVYYIRCPSITYNPGLYAEDGPIFLHQAIGEGVGSLLSLYAGYSHLLQRIVALVAVNLISPEYYPNFFLAVAWFSYLLPIICIEALIMQGAFGALMRIACIPYVIYPYSAETYLNLPNSYIFFPLGFILICYGSVSAGYGRKVEIFQHPITRFLLLIYGLIAAFTGPFVAIYAIPLLIFSFLKRGVKFLRLFWLSAPVLLSSLQIYFSQFHASYPVSTSSAIVSLLKNPFLLIDWSSIHMIGPLLGGYRSSRFVNSFPYSLKLLVIVFVIVLIYFSVKIVIEYAGKAGLFYLTIISTMVISFSSLVVSQRRGIDISMMLAPDLGGRFFFWNTVLCLSILLAAFYISAIARARNNLSMGIILSAWLLTFVGFYYNNITPREVLRENSKGAIVSLDYRRQLRNQCLSSQPLSIQIYPDKNWSFELSPALISRLCSDA